MSQNVYIGMTLKPWPILLDHYSTLEDAIQFARHMINSGMYFAFMGCLSGSSDLDIWLTTFENPIKKPTWPSGKEPKFEIIHEVLTR